MAITSSMFLNSNVIANESGETNKSVVKVSTTTEPINSYSDFWSWFEQNEQEFYTVVKSRDRDNIHKVFFDQISLKLEELKDGFWFVAGMFDDNTAELILTVDGVIKNIVFVEELVKSSPKMSNWKITALKRPSDLKNIKIETNGYTFDESKMNFYSTDHKSMPDQIDITITHQDFNDENRDIMTKGVFLILDNYLGELNAVTAIDNVSIINPKDATSELMPLEKLKDFLKLREKEFVEKYKGFRQNTDNDGYSSFEWTLKNEIPEIAIMNTDLLDWDSKASHPWIAIIEIKYDGDNNNGMPNTKSSTYQLLNEIEDKAMEELKDSDGYLNVGRQTGNSVRVIYFACVDFRKPAKILHKIKKGYQGKIELDFYMYKDKYWETFKRFM